ncbi:MAG: hypothetical protein ACI4PF_02380 [Christensenellales bacterium]
MARAEKEIINEIESYKSMLIQTKSQQRQWQLNQHIKKLQKELIIYKKLIKGNKTSNENIL